jgi:hypothetical protein
MLRCLYYGCCGSLIGNRSDVGGCCMVIRGMLGELVVILVLLTALEEGES